MKAIEIKNAGDNFGMFLMAMNVVFTYNYGTFIILDTHNIDKFVGFCRCNGVSEEFLAKMEMNIVEAPNEIYC